MSVLIDDGEHVADGLADTVAGPVAVTVAGALGVAEPADEGAAPAALVTALVTAVGDDAVAPVEFEVGAQATTTRQAAPAVTTAVTTRLLGVRTVIGSPGVDVGQLGSG